MMMVFACVSACVMDDDNWNYISNLLLLRVCQICNGNYTNNSDGIW